MLDSSAISSIASEYEQQRERNIAALRARQQELGLPTLSKQIGQCPARVAVPRAKRTLVPSSPRRSDRFRLQNTKPDYREAQLVPDRKVYRYYPNVNLLSKGPVGKAVTQTCPAMTSVHDMFRELFGQHKATSMLVRKQTQAVTSVISHLVDEG